MHGMFWVGFACGLVYCLWLYLFVRGVRAIALSCKRAEDERDAPLDEHVALLDRHARLRDERSKIFLKTGVWPPPIPTLDSGSPWFLETIQQHRAKRARQAIRRERVAMLKFLLFGVKTNAND